MNWRNWKKSKKRVKSPRARGSRCRISSTIWRRSGKTQTLSNAKRRPHTTWRFMSVISRHLFTRRSNVAKQNAQYLSWRCRNWVTRKRWRVTNWNEVENGKFKWSGEHQIGIQCGSSVRVGKEWNKLTYFSGGNRYPFPFDYNSSRTDGQGDAPQYPSPSLSL